ncbi:MAG: hypothetical protein ABIM74_09880 [candidate division WOR-3 bacterium]
MSSSLSEAFKAETTSLGEYGPFDHISCLTHSSDGSAWGFRARKSGKHYVIINGKEYGPYKGVSIPGFIEDGSCVFYAATKTKPSYYRVERVKVMVSCE